MRALLVFLLAITAGAAHADDRVALLPLDAEPRLEIYGQPVASEVARAIRGANIEIEVIGAKMAVPKDAKLIVDGTIAAGKNKTEIILTLRIRNPVDGVVLATVTSTAAGIANIDKAASDVTARLLAVLQERLRPATTPVDPGNGNVVEPPKPQTQEMRPLLVSIAMADATSEQLRAALTNELDAQVRRVLRTPQLVDPGKMTKQLATATVKASKLDLGIALDIASYTFEVEKNVPIARARVRMRVTDAVGIVFDRMIVTDSIVGEKNLDLNALADRVAREVLDIARPHLRRQVKAWR